MESADERDNDPGGDDPTAAFEAESDHLRACLAGQKVNSISNTPHTNITSTKNCLELAAQFGV
ncbi:hypothetical protein KSX_01100 [Ktedonospora formicarum]|uniref:Uncharacterized protein n=1 Tax=Ktedonospora formicarum TaxID=2778364 RepID=A0A8J3HWG6_9CHLR|nr:hypothetical protein KSX_01100 [Ktedonospora formicarum]